MIAQFGPDTALLLIDVQKGVHDLAHWGGATGRMNNPGCDDNLRALLAAFRNAGRRVAFTRHDSIEPDSPLKFALPSGAQIDGLEPATGDIVIEKSVNSGFIGTDLELQLRRAGISRLVIAGYFTNFCVETTTRMAGNMGYDTYLVHDACAACNHADLNGIDRDPELVHAMSVGNLHGEFCTAITTADALGLLGADAPRLTRAQGNEADAPAPTARSA
ncbi:cysteine hydrolase family protein [Marimonas lutisalis]|uniref:cysteine hydrolase family protein n=1 Tax=Marimonas lutisalis TaxID=2545756 RepID=UPI0010F65897|nr:cysteine hydrolase family protein [Marimonas lutisalis]